MPENLSVKGISSLAVSAEYYSSVRLVFFAFRERIISNRHAEGSQLCTRGKRQCRSTRIRL